VPHPAWLYDGESAIRREVEVEASGADLLLRHGDGEEARVPAASLIHCGDRSGADVYGRSDVEGWRLGLEGEVPADLAALLPPRARYGRLIDRFGLLPTVATGVAVTALVFFVWSRAPEWIAPHVSPAWENRLGDTLVGDFGGKYCDQADGRAALAKLARQLSPDAARLNIRVVDIDMVNAAALPGGNIVIFDELLAEAEGPDELAGVLAHEIAHVQRRHVTERLIREMGFGALLAALGGGGAANVQSLLSASYSRSDESEADADAVRMLAGASISPEATAGFFERMAQGEKRLGAVAEGLSYVSSHPMSEERQKLFRDSAVKGRTYRASLSEAEWKALVTICRAPAER
jgi:Zn-dependent protease with chaperone function